MTTSDFLRELESFQNAVKRFSLASFAQAKDHIQKATVSCGDWKTYGTEYLSHIENARTALNWVARLGGPETVCLKRGFPSEISSERLNLMLLSFPYAHTKENSASIRNLLQEAEVYCLKLTEETAKSILVNPHCKGETASDFKDFYAILAMGLADAGKGCHYVGLWIDLLPKEALIKFLNSVFIEHRTKLKDYVEAWSPVADLFNPLPTLQKGETESHAEYNKQVKRLVITRLYKILTFMYSRGWTGLQLDELKKIEGCVDGLTAWKALIKSFRSNVSDKN